MSCTTGVWEETGEPHIGLLEDIKEMQILLTIAWTLSRSLLMRHQGHLAPRSPQMPIVTLRTHLASRTHTHHPVVGFLCVLLNGGESKLWQMASEYTQKTRWNLQAKEKPQTCTFTQTLGKQKEGFSIWPGVLQNQKKGCKCKNSTTRGSRKCGAYSQKVGKSFKICSKAKSLAKLMESILSQSHSVMTEGGV